MGRSFSDRDTMILLIYYHLVPIAMTSLVFLLLLLVNRLFAAFCAPLTVRLNRLTGDRLV